MSRTRVSGAELLTLNGCLTQRDSYGVPHIEARNAWDANALLGFCHAQDRLWQLEQGRRLGAGRLAEILGRDAVPIDVLARKLGWRQMAEADLAAEEAAVASGGKGLTILEVTNLRLHFDMNAIRNCRRGS